jgi:hypothetical protein
MHNLGYELVSIRNADSVMALRNKSS